MSLVEESLSQWKSRLAEIEQEIAPLVAESDQLRAAIASVEGSAPSARPSPPRGGGRARRRTAPKRASSTQGRAPRGANRARILASIASEAKTAGQIAKETGIRRGTVATTLTKMVGDGSAVKAKRGYQAS